MTKDPGEPPRSCQHLPMQPDQQDPGYHLSCTLDIPVFCLITSLLPTSPRRLQPLMRGGPVSKTPSPPSITEPSHSRYRDVVPRGWLPTTYSLFTWPSES